MLIIGERSFRNGENMKFQKLLQGIGPKRSQVISTIENFEDLARLSPHAVFDVQIKRFGNQYHTNSYPCAKNVPLKVSLVKKNRI